MKLLLVRHAATERGDDPDTSAADLDARALSKSDRWRARMLGKGLREVVRTLDAVLTSPYLRARQSADVLCDLYGVAAPTVVESLGREAKPAAFLRWLEAAEGSTIAAVGHDAHLASVAGLLVSGRAEPWVPLKRGGACFLELEEARAGAGRLLWVLTPAILRQL